MINERHFMLFHSSGFRERTPSISTLTCDRIGLRNGYVRYRGRKSTSRLFTCSRPFKLHGAKYSKCVNGRWNEEMPICISKFTIFRKFCYCATFIECKTMFVLIYRKRM